MKGKKLKAALRGMVELLSRDGKQPEMALRALIDELLSRDEQPPELHQCPNCGGRLHVTFEVYARAGRKLGIMATCEDCQVAIAEERGDPMPVWMGGGQTE